MITFQVHLKKARKLNQPRLRFDLEKLGDPDVACTFQATISGQFTSLISLRDEDMDINTAGLEIFFQTNLSCRASAPKNSLVLTKNLLALLLRSENEKLLK